MDTLLPFADWVRRNEETKYSLMIYVIDGHPYTWRQNVFFYFDEIVIIYYVKIRNSSYML